MTEVIPWEEPLPEQAEENKSWNISKESLPLASGEYLTFCVDGFGNKGHKVLYWDNGRKGFYPKWEHNPSRREVAWKPILEPYKEEVK